MKKNVFTLSAIALISLSFYSCKKIVSPKKLDGEWTLTSGTHIRASDYDGNGKSNIIKSTYNGSTEVIESTSETGTTTTQTENSSSSYSFNKKEGTYKITSSNTSTSTTIGQFAYTKTATGLYVSAGTYDMKTKKTTQTTQEGTFTITGGTGEIEKNSQIVFSPLKSSADIVSQNTYFVAGTSTVFDITGKYSKAFGLNAYDPLVASLNENTTNTTKTMNPILYNVVSLKDGVMNLVGETSNTMTSGAKTASYSDKYDVILTKKE